MLNQELRVSVLTPSAASRWDDFVYAHPDATFFHLSGWAELIGSVFKHPCHYLYVEQAGHIQAILPLVHMKTRLFGQSLSSLPFAVYGGILATSDASRVALEQAAAALAKAQGLNIIEYRNLRQTHTDWASKDLYATDRKSVV